MLLEVYFRKRRLLRLVNSASTSRDDFFRLLQIAQTPVRNQGLIRAVSAGLTETVEAIFGELGLLVAMTEPSRRQVWFAALALLDADSRVWWFSRDEIKRNELIVVLLSESNERILQMIRSQPPPKYYLSTITKLGETARSPRTYALLWRLMKQFPQAARTIAQRAQAGKLGDPILEIVSMLKPSSARGVCDALRAAERFCDVAQFDEFRRLYETLMQRRGLDEEDTARLARGVPPSAITDTLLERIAFAPPVLGEPFRYCRNWLEIRSTGEFFKNCLRGGDWVARARSGDVQIYRLTENGTDLVLSLIREDGRWKLGEAKLENNRIPPRALRERLCELLTEAGVSTRTCVDVAVEATGRLEPA